MATAMIMNFEEKAREICQSWEPMQKFEKSIEELVAQALKDAYDEGYRDGEASDD